MIGIYFTPLVVPEVLAKYLGTPGHSTSFSPSRIRSIYGRNASDGLEKNQIWLKNDGSILISNDNGSITLRVDGGAEVKTPIALFDVGADGAIKGNNDNGSFELKSDLIII